MMASEAELLTLAGLCEGASGPDRKIDLGIAEALGEKGLNGSVNIAKHRTALLDAAMTLVPNDCAPSVMRCHDGVGRADAHQERTGRMFYAGASTPALALCAVALRARAATMGGSDD